MRLWKLNYFRSLKDIGTCTHFVVLYWLDRQERRPDGNPSL